MFKKKLTFYGARGQIFPFVAGVTNGREEFDGTISITGWG